MERKKPTLINSASKSKLQNSSSKQTIINKSPSKPPILSVNRNPCVLREKSAIKSKSTSIAEKSKPSDEFNEIANENSNLKKQIIFLRNELDEISNKVNFQY